MGGLRSTALVRRGYVVIRGLGNLDRVVGYIIVRRCYRLQGGIGFPTPESVVPRNSRWKPSSRGPQVEATQQNQLHQKRAQICSQL